MSNSKKTAVSVSAQNNNKSDKTEESKEKKSDKASSSLFRSKSKNKPKEKIKTSSPVPIPSPKKSPSPAPSKSSKGPPKAGGNRSNLRLPRLNRSATSIGPSSSSYPGRCRSAASSPCSTKRPLVSVSPRFPANNIPIPVPDYPKAEQVRMRNTASECSPMVNGHARLSYNEGVFSPGLANTSRRRPEFVIHPEWASEVVGADKLPPMPHPFRTKYLNSDSAACGRVSTDIWPKRCKSAPPPNHRNPITWE